MTKPKDGDPHLEIAYGKFLYFYYGLGVWLVSSGADAESKPINAINVPAQVIEVAAMHSVIKSRHELVPRHGKAVAP